MLSPIRMFGGKTRLAPWIIGWFPEHRTYLEPFAGSAAVFFAKPPAPVEILNDVDGDLMHFYRVLRDPDLFPEFVRRAALTPYHRGEYREARSDPPKTDPIDRALSWWIVARQSVSGYQAMQDCGWSYCVTEDTGGVSASVARWLAAIARLPEAHARLRRVQIECDDWETVLERYNRPQTLVYVDPPYVPETRRGGTYRYELTVADHARLVQRLLGWQGPAVLSGYASSVYQPLEAHGWHRLARHVQSSAAVDRHGDQDREECLWISPVGRYQQVHLWDLEPRAANATGAE